DKGYIATANNKITPEDYPYHISNVWAQPYRYDRISEVLETNDNLTQEGMRELQMDTKNLGAREFVPLFNEEIDKSELTSSDKTALNTLNEWQFNDDKALPVPLIFDTLSINYWT